MLIRKPSRGGSHARPERSRRAAELPGVGARPASSRMGSNRTIFTPFNLGITVFTILFTAVFMAIMHPPAEKTLSMPPERLKAVEKWVPPEKPRKEEMSVADKRYTALAQTITGAFVAVATARTYPLLMYWAAGIINYFVPSGGSEWKGISKPK